MPNMTLSYDKETEEVMEDLKNYFGFKTKSAVIHKALSIAMTAKNKADAKDKVVIMSSSKTDKEPQVVSLRK